MVRLMKTDFMMPGFCGVTEFKRCRCCQETKAASAFRILTSGNLVGQCMSCVKDYTHRHYITNKEKRKEQQKAYAILHPQRMRDAFLRWRCKKWGISVSQYCALEQAQNNKCAICKQPQSGIGKQRLCIDHNHTTGKVRGLLCDPCNKMLGHIKDSVETLSNALEYLKKDSSVSGG